MRLWQLAQAGLARCWARRSRVYGRSLPARLRERARSAAEAGAGSQNRIQHPFASQHRTGALRMRGDRENCRHSEQSAPMAAFRQFDPLRLLLMVRPRRLHVQTVQFLKLPSGDREFRIDQIQQGKIIRENFPEKQNGLISNVSLQLGIAPHRETTPHRD